MVLTFIGFVFGVLALITTWRSSVFVLTIIACVIMFMCGNIVANMMNDRERPPGFALIGQMLGLVSLPILFVVGFFV